MRFGRRLIEQAYPPWAAQYIDYEALKERLHDVIAAKESAGRAGASAPAGAALVTARKALFQDKLDHEIRKVLSFYEHQSADLTGRVTDAVAAGRACMERLRTQTETGFRGRSAAGAAEIDATVETAQGLVEELTRLVEYISLCLTAVRKIMKKHVKHLAPQESLGPGFLTLEIEHPDDPEWRAIAGSFLPAAEADRLARMQAHTELRRAMRELRELFEEARDERISLVRFASSSSIIPSADVHMAGIEPALEAMDAAAAQAERDAALVHAVPWVERAAGMFEPPPADELAHATAAGLVLNNLSTLLYMMNYVALLPPIDELCHHIGVSSSTTGSIMAAADMAAGMSAVVISAWTNVSFKQPLACGAAVSVVGNVLFCMSWQRKSLALLLAGRLMTGLGSARAANRRYTADYVSRKQRTMASAAFVAASNLGQGLGPLLYLPLSLLPDTHVHIEGLGLLPLNPVVAIGGTMTLLWLAFLVATLVLFHDPPNTTPVGLARASPSPIAISQLTQPLLPRAALSAAELAEMEGGEAAAAAYVSGKHGNRKGGGVSDGWRVTIAATATCTAALFVQKAVQQSYMDSLPLITKTLYGWTSGSNALFLGLVGVGMVPINVAVGLLSRYASDRMLVSLSTTACAIACITLALGAGAAVPYLSAGLLLFSASVVLEGCATSLMSKVVWSGFARGTFNAGLLSTEAGCLGRFAGNGFLTVVGRATGVHTPAMLAQFAFVLFGGMAAACGLLLLQLVLTYRRLAG